MYERQKELTAKEVAELKIAYGIPEGDKPLYIEDFNFILNYKAKVFDVLEGFWQAEHTGTKEDKDISFEKAMNLAKDLEDYMKSAVPGNIMRRMLFVENIQKEFRGAQVSILWLIHRFDSSLYAKTDLIAEALGMFYEYMCARALVEDGFLEKVETESAAIIADRLKATVETDFLKHINRNNLCYSDIFYLMGHYKKEMDKLKTKEKKLDQEHCIDCKRDDCFTTHCATMDDKIKIDVELKKLKLVCDSCEKKVFGREIDEQTKSKIAKNTQDSWLRQLVCDILDMDTQSASLKKRIVVDWAAPRNICIQPSKVTEVLADSITTLEGVTGWSSQDIAAGIVLNDYDISKGTGDKLHNKFMEEYNRLAEVVKRKTEEVGLNPVSLKVLLEEYNKTKSKNNNEELGGE